jgi:predicted phosphodiesterase
MATAALADIHGNVHALKAVLADPRFEASEQVVVLGDVVAGTFPAETLELVLGLGDRARILRGNADRIVLEEEGGEALWVRGQLKAAQLAAVSEWPLAFDSDVPGLGAVRCCHATPRDDEEIVTQLTPDDELAEALAGTGEPVVVGGHTHVQLDRRVDRWRFVNVGGVGLPYEERPGAYWALLGPDIEHVCTDYDVEAAAAAVLESGQPRAAEVAETLLRPPSPEEAAAEFEAMRGG